jgi:exopolysaccharide production protein ExoY
MRLLQESRASKQPTERPPGALRKLAGCASDAQPEAAIHACFEDSMPQSGSFPSSKTNPRIQLSIKRLFDIIAALSLLAVLSPVLVVAAACVRLSSKGPILFKQVRCGWRGRSRFVCLKFRTMFVERGMLIDRQSLSESEQRGILFKIKNDPRITPIGAFLRKTSIDELPQLLNVLKGEMSLVGPRPLVPHMLAPYPEFRKVRAQVRPGIAGLWQISARDQNTSALQMMPYDLEYIQRFSLWMDFRILLKTPAAVLSAKGAH